MFDIIVYEKLVFYLPLAKPPDRGVYILKMMDSSSMLIHNKSYFMADLYIRDYSYVG